MDATTFFFGTKLVFEGLSIRQLQLSDLKEMASWPKYEGRLLAWANFSASTPELQERWFHSSTGPLKIWLIAKSTSHEGIIGRVSLSQPVEGNELIFGIALRPDVLDQGLGTKITEMILAAVFELTSCDSVWLETQIHNERALHTWTKIGFDLEGTHYRRQTDMQFHLMKSFRFYRSKRDSLPIIEIHRT